MLETLSPQEAMTLFRNGGAFFVDVRTEKEFLKRAIPGCPLVPLDKLEREQGRRAAVVGFSGGMVGGGIVHLGIEFIRAKFGG